MVRRVVMNVSKRVLECPFCYEILEAETPDLLHTAYSSVKPIAKSYQGNILELKYKCQNPKCGRTFTVYWYEPLDYFNRI
jgi:hypothetical protein